MLTRLDKYLYYTKPVWQFCEIILLCIALVTARENGAADFPFSMAALCSTSSCSFVFLQCIDSKAEETISSSHSYPTSSHVHRNWDKLAADIEKEEKNEKLEGDAALNQLFQKIYGEGSDEVKRAMNKSFVESNGTVLSTNWADVGSKKVECKPPDSMEFKKY